MHDHAPDHPRQQATLTGASAFAVSAGLRLAAAAAASIVLWLAVSWALGWW
jgi:hypothetical protein